MDDTTVTAIMGPARRPCQQTSHGYARQSTYRATVLPPRTALQPPTCSSFLLSLRFPLHIIAERTSGTRQWTYRARPNSRPSTTLSLRRAAQSSSVHCGIRPNRVFAPLQRTRSSQTQTYGRTHTIYSGSANGQASVGPRCVLRLVQRAFPPFYWCCSWTTPD
jgi:hypothetical protein